MIDPREHLECITRLAAEITAALDRGEVPAMCDGRLLARNAQILDEEICRRAVAAIRAVPERAAAEDRESQFATKEGERL